MKEKCAWRECKEDATHYPKIMVPAKGWPIELHQPIGAVLSLPTCLQHCKEFNAREFIDTPSPKGDGTNRMIFEFVAKGKCPLDFDRVYVQPVPMNCKEAKILREMKE